MANNSKKRSLHKYSAEQLSFLEQHVKGRSHRQLTEIFNAHFGLSVSIDAIKNRCRCYKWTNGRNGRFQKGMLSWNAGTKGVTGANSGSFKKGQIVWNRKPVGSERISVDDYVEIKVAEPGKWRAKHLTIWEAAHGPLPRSHAVIFADGNRRNFSIDNLLLVSRAELLTLNRFKLIFPDSKATKAGLQIARIKSAVRRRQKEVGS